MAEIMRIEIKIYTIRGGKVMLDRDLADLYQVPTRRLNEQVKRNISRFPEDFMFQLSQEELENWRSQIAISNSDKMGLRRPPYAFTELGVSMLSSVLKSEIAIEINIKIMRAFVELRQEVASNPEYNALKERVRRIESQMEVMGSNDMVDSMLIEKKMLAMSSDIRRISETLDRFQDAYIVVKRPEDLTGES